MALVAFAWTAGAAASAAIAVVIMRSCLATFLSSWVRDRHSGGHTGGRSSPAFQPM